jgi:putative transposase
MAEGSETRITHRNGYRPRLWETRVGEIELAIPRKRSGPAYFPSFLEPRRRSEQAIVVVVLEAYVNGCRPACRAAGNRRDGQGLRLASVPSAR